MTYEEILALQERIGFVNKGLSKDKINALPMMMRKELSQYFDKL